MKKWFFFLAVIALCMSRGLSAARRPKKSKAQLRSELMEMVAELDGTGSSSSSGSEYFNSEEMEMKVDSMRNEKLNSDGSNPSANTGPSPISNSNTFSSLNAHELLVEQLRFKTTYSIQGIRHMTFKIRSTAKRTFTQTPNQVELLAIIDTTNTVHIYSEDGTELCDIKLPFSSSAEITAIRSEGKEVLSPTIVVAATDGKVAVLSLAIYKGTKLVAGRSRVRLIKREDMSSGLLNFSAYVTLDTVIDVRSKELKCDKLGGECIIRKEQEEHEENSKTSNATITTTVDTNSANDTNHNIHDNRKNKKRDMMPTLIFDEDMPPRKNRYVTAIHIYQKAADKNQNLLILGDNYATLTAFTSLGEILNSQKNFIDILDPRQLTSKQDTEWNKRQPILDITRVGQIMACAIANTVKLIHVGKMKPYGYDCYDAAGTVTTLVTDPYNALVLYAMTTNGKISVFHVKDQRGMEKARATCRHINEIKPDDRLPGGVGLNPSTSISEINAIEKAASIGRPYSNFANVRGLMLSSGSCGMTLYAPRNMGSANRQSTQFTWTSIDELKPTPKYCKRQSKRKFDVVKRVKKG
jgi:hypothetical protein